MRKPSIKVTWVAATTLVAAGAILTGGCPDAGDGGTGTGGQFNLPPTIVLTTDIVRGVAPLSVGFSSSGSTDNGVIVSRAWDFGDGGTSAEIAPTYVFQNNGDFTVTLTLTDDLNASSSKTISISITDAPIAVLQVDRVAADNAPAAFSFDASDSVDPDAAAGDVLGYHWNFGDGIVSTVAVIPHTYATAGAYRVILTVTDATGVTGTAEQMIELGIPAPEIEFRSPPDSIRNLVLTPSTPLWVQAVYDVEPGVPFRVRVGLDGDLDPCNAQVAVYDVDSGAEVARLEEHSDLVNSAVYSPDATLVLSGSDDGTAVLFDVATGDALRTYTGVGDAVNSVAFASDGESFLLGAANQTVALRDTDSDTVLQAFVGHAAAVNSVALSPDDTQGLSGDEDGIAILWNIADGTELRRFDHAGQAVNAVAFSPTEDRSIVTGCADGIARLWSTLNGVLQLRLVGGHTGAINAVAFSNDGDFLLTGGADDLAILWRLSDGAIVETFTGHSGDVLTVAFAPDDSRIATGGNDHTARIWDVASGTLERAIAPCISAVSVVGFSPDGDDLLIGVAAASDIQLDTDPPNGNDMNIVIPAALDISGVPAGTVDSALTYRLWLELTTDRSAPARTYATAAVRVLPEFARDLTDPTVVPLIPLAIGSDEEASIAVPATRARQIFSLGGFEAGDRLFLSLMTLPGYGETYFQNGFSVLILDNAQELFAWYQDERTLFSKDTRLIVGHDSTHYYVVLDGMDSAYVTSLNVSVERDFATDSLPRQQYIHLNFDGTTQVAVYDSAAFDVAAFDPSDRGDAADAAVQAATVARVTALLAAYDVVVSEDPPASSATPVNTIYFDCTGAMVDALNITDHDVNGDFAITAADLMFYGLPSFIDPRNVTLSGRAVVSVDEIIDANGGLADAALGTAIGNAVVHQIGLLSGLRPTTGNATDIMTETVGLVTDGGLGFVTASLLPSADLTAIGTQDGDQLLIELFGP